MSDYEPTADDLAAVRRMKAAEQRLLDSGAPPSTLSRGKQAFEIGMNADGTLNLIDPASPRTDSRNPNGTQPIHGDSAEQGEGGPGPHEPNRGGH